MTIIDFDDLIKVWTDSNGNQIFKATQTNIKKAIEYVESLEADKGTNINDALIQALSIIDRMKRHGKEERQYMIIFLTDGHVSPILITLINYCKISLYKSIIF